MPKTPHIIMYVNITTQILHTTEFYYFICSFCGYRVRAICLVFSKRTWLLKGQHTDHFWTFYRPISSFDCRVCMYVYMWMSGFLYMYHTLSRVTLYLGDRARLVCSQYQGKAWKNHLFSSFFSYFSTSHSVTLSHPLKPSYLLFLSTLYLSLAVPLTCFWLT